MSLWSFEASFGASALAMLAAGVLAARMSEPPREVAVGAVATQGAALRAAFAQSVLRWIFVLAVVMYGFSHVPFVFGQPFIAEALGAVGLDDEVPLVSGAVSATMMGVSVTASLFALRLRGRLGLTGILLLAFAMQIALVAVLTLTQSWLAIAVLFFRMVPDALSRPFLMARIQPLLRNEARATYVSLQSLAGKLAFGATLLIAAGSAADVGEMPYADIRAILTWYAAAGLALWLGLGLTARRAGVEPARGAPHTPANGS